MFIENAFQFVFSDLCWLAAGWMDGSEGGYVGFGRKLKMWFPWQRSLTMGKFFVPWLIPLSFKHKHVLDRMKHLNRL